MYKLVIVEDEQFIRKWLAYAIDYSKLGISVIGEAENGQEGAVLIQQLQPDIVMTDINMPLVNAFTMFHETKHIDYKKIILSGYSDFENAKQALKHGVRDFISKPIVIEELQSSLLEIVADLSSKPSQPGNMVYENIVPVQKKETNLSTEIIDWVKHNYMKKVTLSELCHDIGYSESTIYRHIKEHFGTTLNDYLNRYRIKMAIHFMVEDTSFRIYEIAEHVGFSDYNYFNKVFKKYIGMTLTEFKTQLL